MSRWTRYTISFAVIEAVMAIGTLPRWIGVDGLKFSRLELDLAPDDDNVVSFASFHDRGFDVPSHPFFRGLLHYYGLEFQHLNPNGIQHIVTFIALCESFLGIEPNFDLWKYFFLASFIKAMATDCPQPFPVGCASIHLRGHRAKEYASISLPSSHRGWHGQWFYL